MGKSVDHGEHWYRTHELEPLARKDGQKRTEYPDEWYVASEIGILSDRRHTHVVYHVCESKRLTRKVYAVLLEVVQHVSDGSHPRYEGGIFPAGLRCVAAYHVGGEGHDEQDDGRSESHPGPAVKEQAAAVYDLHSRTPFSIVTASQSSQSSSI